MVSTDSSDTEDVPLRATLRRSAVVVTAEDARVALLSRLIDHAPLFPPASLGFPDALAEDRRARESPSAFVLGRFVCPVSRLDELPDVGRGVSAVLEDHGDGPRKGTVPSFSALEPDHRVEAAEAPPGADLSALEGVAREIYVEVPVDAALDDRLDQLASLGLRAKVRCGGAAAPDVSQLARFVRACHERAVVFKATAGLHHAVRSNGEHGFLNLLAAVVFGDEEDVLADEEPDAFVLDRERFGWRGRSAGVDELARARRQRLQSIGSCSFFEPVEELEALGVLPL